MLFLESPEKLRVVIPEKIPFHCSFSIQLHVEISSIGLSFPNVRGESSR